MREERERLPVSVMTEERVKELKGGIRQEIERIWEAIRIRLELYPEVVEDIVEPFFRFVWDTGKAFWVAVWNGQVFPFVVRVSDFTGKRTIDKPVLIGRTIAFILVASVQTLKIVLGQWRLWFLGAVVGMFWLFSKVCNEGLVCWIYSGLFESVSDLLGTVLAVVFGLAFVAGSGLGVWRTCRAYSGLKPIVISWLDRRSGVIRKKKKTTEKESDDDYCMD